MGDHRSYLCRFDRHEYHTRYLVVDISARRSTVFCSPRRSVVEPTHAAYDPSCTTYSGNPIYKRVCCGERALSIAFGREPLPTPCGNSDVGPTTKAPQPYPFTRAGGAGGHLLPPSKLLLDPSVFFSPPTPGARPATTGLHHHPRPAANRCGPFPALSKALTTCAPAPPDPPPLAAAAALSRLRRDVTVTPLPSTLPNRLPPPPRRAVAPPPAVPPAPHDHHRSGDRPRPPSRSGGHGESPNPRTPKP
jgi:hypothetical protein